MPELWRRPMRVHLPVGIEKKGVIASDESASRAGISPSCEQVEPDRELVGTSLVAEGKVLRALDAIRTRIAGEPSTESPEFCKSRPSLSERRSSHVNRKRRLE